MRVIVACGNNRVAGGRKHPGHTSGLTQSGSYVCGEWLVEKATFAVEETTVRVLIDQWRREYNQFRPHSALHYRPLAPEAILVPALT